MEKKFLINGNEVSVQDYKIQGDRVSFTLEGKHYSYRLLERRGSGLVLEGKERFRAHLGAKSTEGEAMVISHGYEAMVAEAGKKSRKKAAALGGLTSPMPGKIFKVVKEEGCEVQKGDTILILEAMKMEHSIRADKDGVVKKICFKPGELVQGGVTLAEVE